MRMDDTNGEGPGPAASPLARLQHRLRGSWTLFFFELLAVAAIFYADNVLHVIWFSKTLYLFALGVVSLAVRGVSWRRIGVPFSWPGRKWLVPLIAGIAAGVLIEAQELFLTQPLLIHLTGTPPDLSDFHEVRGNWKLAAIGLPLIWVMAGFGEEWVWRGWLMNRVAAVFRKPWLGWLVSLAAVNAMFGLAHFYQGLTGMVEAGLDGVLFGLVYLAAGRNLWVAVLAHGVQDTTDLVLIFTGTYPTPV